MSVLSISNVIKNEPPFEGLDREKDFVSIESILNKPLYIREVKPFVSLNKDSGEKNPGVYVKFSFTAESKEEKFICTHSIGLTKTFNDIDLMDVLAAGTQIECQIVKVPSMLDKSKKVFKVTALQ